jgi:uncharacterized RDD family membrane protein YckC
MQPAQTLTVAPNLLRICAFLIDLAILVVVNAALLGAVDPQALEGDGVTAEAYAAGSILSAVYYIGFLAIMSATPGKLAMGLYVADRNGARVRPDTAILRFIVFFVGNAIFIGMVASFGLLFFDRNHRTVHDRVAGTIVLRRPQGGETPPPDLS